MQAVRSGRVPSFWYDTDSEIANALGIFAPALTLVVFAIVARLQGSQMDVSTAFTTVAILALVTEPANMIMTIVPKAFATSANFERIQAYLLEPSRIDQRQISSRLSDVPTTDRIEAAVDIDGVTIKSPSANESLLQNIELRLRRGSITACSGAVGSGKSILAKAILGEIVPSEVRLQLHLPRLGSATSKHGYPQAKSNK